ncbi:MAG: hypothetical protein HONBIEJF_00049 [Fimbriimonadaceae bacterium]|nr:hypothetical protein [Fimbriimonadaceae bacterium]
MSHGLLASLTRLSQATSHRISSFDRTGGNADYIKISAGSEATLAEMNGAGAITHIWITFSSKDPLARRNLVLRMYWDGSAEPSVESPIGDFFGQGWGEKYVFASLPLAAAPRDGNALVCYFRMPFRTGARLTLTNESDLPVDAFYYYVDYEQLPSHDEAYFHAGYRQELTLPESSDGDRENEWSTLGEAPKNPTDANNYVFCEAEGKGHFVGINYYVNCPSPMWYGEGDDMFCVDGEPWPFSLHGTGTEDYFNQSWSPDEVYQHPYFGTARAPGNGNSDPRFGWLGRTHCYRFHLEDPIRFRKSLRASIEHGHANVLTLELASVAYWYLDHPARACPPLPPAKEREPRPIIQPADVHVWRDAWRLELGSGSLWGSESRKR